MKVIMGIEKLKIKGTEEATVMLQGMGVTEDKKTNVGNVMPGLHGELQSNS